MYYEQTEKKCVSIKLFLRTAFILQSDAKYELVPT